MNYKRISFIDTDTGEVLGNALLGDNEELIVKTENANQMEAIKRKLKLSNEIIFLLDILLPSINSAPYIVVSS